MNECFATCPSLLSAACVVRGNICVIMRLPHYEVKVTAKELRAFNTNNELAGYDLTWLLFDWQAASQK